MSKLIHISVASFLMASVSFPAFAEVTKERVAQDLKSLGMTWDATTDREPGMAMSEAGIEKAGYFLKAPVLLLEEVSGKVRITAPDGISVSRGGEEILAIEPGDVSIMTDGLASGGDSSHSISSESLWVSVPRSAFGPIRSNVTGLSAEISGTPGISGDADMSATYSARSVAGTSEKGAEFGASSVAGSASFSATEAFLIAMQLGEMSESVLPALSAAANISAEEVHATIPSDDAGKMAFHAATMAIGSEIGSGEATLSIAPSGISGSFSGMGDFPSFGAASDSVSLTAKVPLAGFEESPFMASYDMKGITLTDDFWSVIDPESSLDRAPGIVRAVSSGRLDPEDPYGAPKSLRVEDFFANIAGVTLNANATLDISGSSVDDVSGSGRVILSGAEGLISAAESSGIAPRQGIAAARMGLAMFFRNGGDGKMSSEIQSEDGKVTVNGIRIR